MVPSHLRLPLRFVLRIFLHHRWRVAATIAGIATASLLILVQASFFFGFRDAVTAIPLRAKADLWVAACKHAGKRNGNVRAQAVATMLESRRR